MVHIFWCNDLEIRGVSFDGKDSASESIVPIVGLRSSYAIDYDFETNTIFTVDDSLDAIYKVKQDGSQLIPIINTTLQGPQGLAVDWVSKNMYWTDSSTRLIEVCRLDFFIQRPTLIFKCREYLIKRLVYYLWMKISKHISRHSFF